MESKFESFLKSLTDHELAIYVGYQNESFLKYSKEIVKTEINFRHLTKEQLDEYLNAQLSHNDDELFCQQCGSNRFIKDKDIEHGGGTYLSTETEVTTNRCRLCNYNPSKSTTKSLLKRIKELFTGDPNKTEKTIRTYDWFGN